MKILILSQYYPPETGACANRISGFARHLADRHEVTVVTGFPNYPYGRVYSGYKRSWCAEDRDGKVKLLRTWLSVMYPKKPIHRFLNYLGFFVSSISVSLFRTGKTDIVVATSGPILVGFAGALVSMIKRKPFVLDLRDVWPERVVAAGEFTNPAAIKVLEWIEQFMYRRAAQIICVTPGLAENLAKRGVPITKLVLVTNGTDTRLFASRNVNGFEAYGIPPHAFVVIYAGTFGLLQDHELLLRAAEKLRSYPDIWFVFVGDGVRRTSLVDEVRKRELERVRILPNMAKEELAALLVHAEIGVNANTNIQHNEMAIPVKIFDYMAAELPIVIANNGSVKELVHRNRVGFCTPPGEEAAFTEAVLKFYRDKSLRKEAGGRGRKLVREQFDTAILGGKFEQALENAGRI